MSILDDLWWPRACYGLYVRLGIEKGRDPEYFSIRRPPGVDDQDGHVLQGKSFAAAVRAVCSTCGILVASADEGGIAQLSTNEWRRVARQMATAIDPKSNRHPDQPEGWRAMWERANE